MSTKKYWQVLVRNLPVSVIKRIKYFRRVRTRSTYMVYQRWELMIELRTKYKFSYPDIGTVLDMSHTSALYGVKRFYKKYGV